MRADSVKLGLFLVVIIVVLWYGSSVRDARSQQIGACIATSELGQAGCEQAVDTGFWPTATQTP